MSPGSRAALNWQYGNSGKTPPLIERNVLTSFAAPRRHGMKCKDRRETGHATSQRPPRSYPRFATGTFWNFRSTCEAVGRRCPAPPLGLITMAALLPPEWTVRLVDCNAEVLTDDDLAWADLAMTGGMLVQQRQTFAIIRRCRSHGLRVAVGGPDAASSPHLYCEADYLVLGEVESIIFADFVAAVDNGVASGRFEAQRWGLNRYCDGADPAIRPAQLRPLHPGRRPILERLPVRLRVL